MSAWQCRKLSSRSMTLQVVLQSLRECILSSLLTEPSDLESCHELRDPWLENASIFGFCEIGMYTFTDDEDSSAMECGERFAFILMRENNETRWWVDLNKLQSDTGICHKMCLLKIPPLPFWSPFWSPFWLFLLFVTLFLFFDDSIRWFGEPAPRPTCCPWLCAWTNFNELYQSTNSYSIELEKGTRSLWMEIQIPDY